MQLQIKIEIAGFEIKNKVQREWERESKRERVRELDTVGGDEHKVCVCERERERDPNKQIYRSNCRQVA